MSLAADIQKKRWYRTKTRRVEDARIARRYALGGAEMQVAELALEGGGKARYLLLEPEDFTSVLRVMAEKRTIDDLQGHALVALDAGQPARAISGEQTNTSIVYGQAYVGKLVRKLDEGESPDLEMSRFLTEAGYKGTPELLGWIDIGGATAAILYRFVANQGDAWSDALVKIRGGQGYERQARLLGQRVAEMHAALATGEDARFAPEPLDLTPVLEGIRRSMPALPVDHAAIEQRLAATPRGTKTRVHGDLHLGQILVTGDDFVILDFEGEPARPLAERKAKRSPLVDVAGMIRSFHYAAVGENAPDWYTTSKRAFLEGYGEVDRELLDLFLLEKCLYEIGYEMNNRPDWVHIPLAGLREILSHG
jgi:predicted trehalose synthase